MKPENTLEGTKDLPKGDKDLSKGTKDLLKGTKSKDLLKGTKELSKGTKDLSKGTKDLPKGDSILDMAVLLVETLRIADNLHGGTGAHLGDDLPSASGTLVSRLIFVKKAIGYIS